MMLTDVVSVLSGLVLAYYTRRQARFNKTIGNLHTVEPLPLAQWPKVSIIVPACNEAHSIGPALKTLFALDYPNLEFVLVNDRSSDGTGAIMAELCQQEARAKYIEVGQLPAGWLGKVHALKRGTEAATGEWLLFSDADIHFAPMALKKAISHVQNQKLDFLTVLPRFVARGFSLRLAMAAFLQSSAFALQPDAVKDPNSPMVAGIGAFNLVSRAVLPKTPGFSWLRHEVMDDLGMGLMIKRYGGRCELISGCDDLRIEWYPSFSAFVMGLEKNGFAMLEFSWRQVALNLGLALGTLAGVSILPFFSTATLTKLFVVVTIVAYTLQSAKILRAQKFNPWYAALFPISMLIFPLILLRSAIVCANAGGIRWRGTFYPLSELRAGQRVKVTQMLR